MTPGQAMSDEQAVKKVYQDAVIVVASEYGYAVTAQGHCQSPIISGWFPLAILAWADARAKLPPAASPEAPKKCTCPESQWIGSEPNDSTCELTEEEHQALAPPSQPRAVELPPLHNMPNLERRYGRFTEDSIERYDKARLQQREAELQTALELLTDEKTSTFHTAHTKEREFKYSNGIYVLTCHFCQRLDQSKLLEGK